MFNVFSGIIRIQLGRERELCGAKTPPELRLWACVIYTFEIPINKDHSIPALLSQI